MRKRAAIEAIRQRLIALPPLQYIGMLDTVLFE